MLTSVMLRARTDSDLPGCVATLHAVHRQDRYPTWWPEDPAGWLSPLGTVAAWVALDDDGSVLGHVCVVSPVEDHMVAETLGVSVDRLAAVSRLFVSPAARGRALRLGSRLLDAARDWAELSGLQLMLDVLDDGAPAVELYERCGWQLVDRRQTDWLTPEGLRHGVRVYVAP